MYKILITAALVLGATFATRAADNVLSLRHCITDSTIVYPESFEMDTKRMQENWYLRNYTVIDNDADSSPDRPVTDEEIIERLSLMPTVIEMPFNSVVKNYIMRYVENSRQLVVNMLGLGLYYMPIFEAALDRYGMPLELKYLPVIESALNPNAVSRAGATGLWQFMIPTARGLNLEINSVVDQRRDPYASSDAAARYLKELYETFGDWSLAIAAYNCGPGNVNKALRKAGGGKKDFWEIYPYLPQETRGYVPAFIAANYVMTYYPLHNIRPALARRPIVTDTVNVSRRVHFEQISEVLGIPMDEIRVLNPQYRADNIPGDIHPYSLVLPSLQTYAYVANEDSIVNHRAADFARRGIVEPAVAQTKGSDKKGEYVQEEVVQYYKVKKGDTLSKIANRFGVTVASIRKVNNCGKTVKPGRRLKIVTYKKTYIPSPESTQEQTPTVATETTVSTDSIAAPVDSLDNAIIEAAVAVEPGNMEIDLSDAIEETVEETAPAKAQPAAQPKAKEQKTTARTQKSQGTVTHTVRKGENLYRISKQYGVSMKEILDANHLSSDQLKIGQKLKIPKK